MFSSLYDAYNTVDVGFMPGYILEDGTISTLQNDPDGMHSKYVTTDIIDGGCAITLKLNSGFKLKWLAFFDYAGKLLNRRETRPQGVGYRYGIDYGRLIPKQYKVRFQIEKEDGLDFVDGDNPISVFRRTLPEYFQKADKSTISNYEQGRKRIDAMCFAPYYTQAGYYGHSISKGTWHLGVAYGGSSTDGAMIGAFMSVRNYLTQMANKRSLLYSQRYYWRNPDTKNIADLTSSFYNYPSISSKRYLGFVGAVCDTIPSVFFGFRKHLNVAYLKTGGTTVTVDSVDEIDEKVNVADIIIEEVVRHSSGAVLYCDHIVLISDKIYNNDGELEYIEICELGGTCATSAYRYLTPQGFYYYLNDNQLNTSKNESKKWTIWRTNFNTTSHLFGTDLTKTEDVEGVIPGEELFFDDMSFNHDICTFLGDYATVFAGDMLYLNVNNYGSVSNHNWNTVIIYKDGVDTPYQTIPIKLSLDSDGESRADIDITSYFTAKEYAGDYTAIAFDSVSGIESAPTHFRIVYFTHFEYNTRLAYEASGSKNNNRCFAYFDKSDNAGYVRAGYVIASENFTGDATKPTSSSSCANGYNVIRCTNNVNDNGLQYSLNCESGKYQSMPVRTVYSVPNKINKLYSDSYYYPESSSYTLTNGYFNMNTGAINTSSSCKVSRYIPVEPGHTYRFAFKNAGSTKYQAYGTRICYYSGNQEDTTDTYLGYQVWNNPFREKGTEVTDTDPLAGNDTTSVAADNKYYYCDIQINRSDISYIRVSSKYNNTERSLVDITEYVGECEVVDVMGE